MGPRWSSPIQVAVVNYIQCNPMHISSKVSSRSNLVSVPRTTAFIDCYTTSLSPWKDSCLAFLFLAPKYSVSVSPHNSGQSACTWLVSVSFIPVQTKLPSKSIVIVIIHNRAQPSSNPADCEIALKISSVQTGCTSQAASFTSSKGRIGKHQSLLKSFPVIKLLMRDRKVKRFSKS